MRTAGGMRGWLLATGACGLLFGCAHRRPVPNELTEARAIFARASAGPARRHASARLAQAQEALNAAEQAYLRASPIEAEDRAYVAARRSELAEAEASTVIAIQRRTSVLQELASLTGPHADRARAELAAAGQKEGTSDGTLPLAAAGTNRPGGPSGPSLPAGSAPATPSITTPAGQLQPARTQETTLPAPTAPTADNPGLVPARAVESQSVMTPTPPGKGDSQTPTDLVPPPVSVTPPEPRPAAPGPPTSPR